MTAAALSRANKPKPVNTYPLERVPRARWNAQWVNNEHLIHTIYLKVLSIKWYKV